MSATDLTSALISALQSPVVNAVQTSVMKAQQQHEMAMVDMLAQFTTDQVTADAREGTGLRVDISV